MSREVLHAVLLAAFVAVGCGTSAGRIDAACRSNADCGETELCATGICEGGLGTCVERPTECEAGRGFVCGCDGRTYPRGTPDTACFASQEGIRLAQLGPCLCEDNSDCDADQYCALDDSCLNPGECLPRPLSCEDAEVEPVCGCDGMPYDNPCSASQVGVRVSASGVCNCTANTNCQAGEFCDAMTCDGPGVCTSQDVACPPAGAPATGCDGIVYDSACDANRNGQRVRP